MLFKDLRDFIELLDTRGELIRVTDPVSPDLEIACIADRMSKLPPEHNKALLFENVRGSTMPVLINAFGSAKRLNIMAGTSGYKAMTSKLSGFLEVLQTPRRNLVEKLEALPMLRDVARCFPTYVKRAPCQENIWRGEAVDLTRIPILKCWPEDAGHFVTFPLVFTKDPIDGKRNCGMYRLQRYDKNTLGFHCHTHHTGADHIRKARARGQQRLELAVVIGAAPAVTFSAVVPLPPGLDEMIFAGFLNEAPVPMVKCLTVDQEVPASAEIVLEGYVDVDERRREGPFGDHTGHYSLADDYWVFHVTCVTTRSSPIYHATVVGPPPQEDSHMAKAIERLFLPLMQQPIHEVVDYSLPFEGVAHNLMLTTIDKSYPGQGKKVAHAVWGLGQAMFTKVHIVGDDSMPKVTQHAEWARRIARRMDVARDIEFVLGPAETLDHASRDLYFSSKVSVDVTKALANEPERAPFPEALATPSDQEIFARLNAIESRITRVRTPWQGEWRHLLLIALDKCGASAEGNEPEAGQADTRHLTAISAHDVVRRIWQEFPELPCAQRIVVFDADEELNDLPRLTWLALSNIDPERDMVFDLTVTTEFGRQTVKRHPRRIGIDATTKGPVDGFARRWPKEQKHPSELIDQLERRFAFLNVRSDADAN